MVDNVPDSRLRSTYDAIFSAILYLIGQLWPLNHLTYDDPVNNSRHSSWRFFYCPVCALFNLAEDLPIWSRRARTSSPFVEIIIPGISRIRRWKYSLGWSVEFHLRRRWIDAVSFISQRLL